MDRTPPALSAPSRSTGEKRKALLQRAPLLRAPRALVEPERADVLGRLGTLEVKLATGSKEVNRAQRLRYKVFFEECGAIPDFACRMQRRDCDAYDAICDHLLVLDHAAAKLPGGKPKVIGTYRLLRQDVAERHVGFYSAAEFDIGPLLARHPNTRFLELGRSCVLADYRNKRTVELLWHGIWTYVRRHRIDAMFGCASLPGTRPEDFALPLSFLHHHALAPAPWLVEPLINRQIHMDFISRDKIDRHEAVRRLPPLLKGYLRAGARFGSGAVLDAQFRSMDVFVVLPIANIATRYLDYFGPQASRYTA
jgi:L-ornithine Nalpha-acyltransferase